MAKSRMVGITVTAIFVSSIMAYAQDDVPFDAGCQLPFQSIAVEHKGVDDSCGIGGVASDTDKGNQKQNRIKNNFCLKSTPVPIDPKDLISLQSKVDQLTDFKYGSGRSVPTDREPLKELLSKNGGTIGEGTLVTVAGYMIDPHYSDVKKGEGVNCKRHGNEPNDIHFSIGTKWVDVDELDKDAKQAQLCMLVTGEISPHFRPETWEVSHLGQLDRIPVRLTGQVFFDASHVPCREGKPVNPARKSVWEIHPVYQIDVCKSTKQCRVGVDSDWISLNEWASSKEEQDTSETEE
jgi:hypothetical protein